jgi:GNAT superfamily N-acetyltransferase
MEERIVYSVESYADISEVDCENYQTMFNSEYPILISRATLQDCKDRLLDTKKPTRIFTARSIKSEGSRLVGLIIVKPEHEKQENIPWLSMVIQREYQRKGIGSTLLEKAKQYYEVLHGWCTPDDGYEREDGSIYPSPLDFYKKHGFKVVRESVDLVEGLDLVEIAWCKES